jgi:hypothetical protein
VEWGEIEYCCAASCHGKVFNDHASAVFAQRKADLIRDDAPTWPITL